FLRLQRLYALPGIPAFHCATPRTDEVWMQRSGSFSWVKAPMHIRRAWRHMHEHHEPPDDGAGDALMNFLLTICKRRLKEDPRDPKAKRCAVTIATYQLDKERGRDRMREYVRGGAMRWLLPNAPDLDNLEDDHRPN